MTGIPDGACETGPILSSLRSVLGFRWLGNGKTVELSGMPCLTRGRFEHFALKAAQSSHYGLPSTCPEGAPNSLAPIRLCSVGVLDELAK
jgi:hypothetical protein